MEKAYIVPGWVTIIAGLIIHRDRKVLLGLRSARAEAGRWCLPAGSGVVRRDISDVLAKSAPLSLNDPMNFIQIMSERHKQALLSPAGFALAEARWYVELPPEITPGHLEPLKPICQLDSQNLLVKLYFGLRWQDGEPPKPAKTEWPFVKAKFFTQQELADVSIAFGCGKDLETIFW